MLFLQKFNSFCWILFLQKLYSFCWIWFLLFNYIGIQSCVNGLYKKIWDYLFIFFRAFVLKIFLWVAAYWDIFRTLGIPLNRRYWPFSKCPFHGNHLLLPLKGRDASRLPSPHMSLLQSITSRSMVFQRGGLWDQRVPMQNNFLIELFGLIRVTFIYIVLEAGLANCIIIAC